MKPVNFFCSHGFSASQRTGEEKGREKEDRDEERRQQQGCSEKRFPVPSPRRCMQPCTGPKAQTLRSTSGGPDSGPDPASVTMHCVTVGTTQYKTTRKNHCVSASPAQLPHEGLEKLSLSRLSWQGRYQQMQLPRGGQLNSASRVNIC